MLVIFHLFSLLLSVHASPRNITIDDQYGDVDTNVLPVYSPDGGWTQGASCNGCAFHPTIAETFDSTWHDTTHHIYDAPKTIQFNFTGTALIVYCIIPNSPSPYITSLYDLQFLMNGSQVGNFSHASDSSGTYQYQVPVFATDNLANATHAFTITAASTTVNSTILFDYAVYTFDDGIPDTLPPASPTSSSGITSSSSPSPTPSPSSSTSTHLGAILGGAIGGLAFLLALVFAGICLHRRRRRRMYLHPTVYPLSPPRFNPNPIVEPFVLRNPPRQKPSFIERDYQAMVTQPPGLARKPNYKKDYSGSAASSWSTSQTPGNSTSDVTSSHTRTPGNSRSGAEIVQLRQQVADLRSQHQAMVGENVNTPLPGYSF